MAPYRWKWALRFNGGPLRAVAPIVAAVSIVAAGNGLLTTRTSLELTLSGSSAADVRAIVTGYPVGFMMGCVMSTQIIRQVGHGRTFQAMAALSALATLGFGLGTDVVAWTLLRVINGFAVAALFTVTESWINLDSPPNSRGSLISFYMIMSTLGLAVGQALVGLGDPGGFGLLVLAAVICLLGALPLSLSGRLLPARGHQVGTVREHDERLSLWGLFKATPIAVIAAAQVGMTNMNFGVMAPIYAVRVGHGPGTAAALVTIFSVGGLLAQFPLGRLSDRVDRRLLIVCLAGSATFLCVCIASFGAVSLPLLYMLFFLYGAATLSIYPVAMAYTGARIERRFLVAGSSGLLLVYSVGSIAAPAISNELMIVFDPPALFLFLGGLAATVTVVAAIEPLFRRRR